VSRRLALAAPAIAALVAGCTPTASAPAAKASASLPSPSQTSRPAADVPVDGGFGKTELFCVRRHAVGAIGYQVADGRASLTLAVGGLPTSASLGVAWLNNRVRGYTIASFDTDPAGYAVQSSLRMFRPGEVRGAGMILSDSKDHVVASLAPCP